MANICKSVLQTRNHKLQCDQSLIILEIHHYNYYFSQINKNWNDFVGKENLELSNQNRVRSQKSRLISPPPSPDLAKV